MTDTAVPADRAARSFRPTSRRRARIALGAAIAAIAVGGNVLIYSALDDRSEVVQFASSVYAGDRITAADVRIVEVDADLASTALVPADRVGLIVDQYARTFIPAGALASEVLVRPTPAVTPGTAIVSVAPSGGRLPRGVVERARVWLVLGDDTPAPIEARVVALDRDGVADGAISVEVAPGDAATVANAEEVHVVLIEPENDPANTDETSGG